MWGGDPKKDGSGREGLVLEEQVALAQASVDSRGVIVC